MLRFAFLLTVAATAIWCSDIDAHCFGGRARRPATVTDLCCESSATVVLQVPPNTKVYFDDLPTMQTGATRTYVTPPLPLCGDFTYQVKVDVGQGSQMQSETRAVLVRAYCTTVVDFTTSQDSPEALPQLKDLPKLPEFFFPSVEP